mmetsp:Transcript_89658/g.204950  ORF Transcript_89658/g.204950 Transcript_89658/m.204950 type:complete len:230 (+) Transcript_89658:463-1152(+)
MVQPTTLLDHRFPLVLMVGRFRAIHYHRSPAFRRTDGDLSTGMLWAPMTCTTWISRLIQIARSGFFVAPESYYHRALAASYGGTIQFTVRATYGDFDFLNSPLDWITLDCSSCNNGKGIRIVRYVDELLRWDGSEKTVSVVIAVGHGWKRDPLNAGLPISDASECEIAAVLQGVTRLRILGDFVQAGEGVALDDVSVSAAANQPAYPVACQGGCLCTHYPVRRMACCGN